MPHLFCEFRNPGPVPHLDHLRTQRHLLHRLPKTHRTCQLQHQTLPYVLPTLINSTVVVADNFALRRLEVDLIESLSELGFHGVEHFAVKGSGDGESKGGCLVGSHYFCQTLY